MRIIAVFFLLQLPFATFAQTCNPPAKVTIDMVWVTTGKISWSPVNGAMGYECWIDPNPTPPASGFGTTDTFTSLTNLDADMEYYAHVRTKCNGNDFSAWKTHPFKTLPTNINTVEAGNTITVYPNPATSAIKLSGLKKGTGFGIYDISGKVVKTETAGGNVHETDISSFSKGQYFIRILNAPVSGAVSFEIR